MATKGMDSHFGMISKEMADYNLFPSPFEYTDTQTHTHIQTVSQI